MTELDAEDAKLVVLARGAMGRAEAASGAAVRDLDGRTYAGAPVALDGPAADRAAGGGRRGGVQRRDGSGGRGAGRRFGRRRGRGRGARAVGGRRRSSSPTGRAPCSDHRPCVSEFRSGFVCFVGRPNTGKSTLTNALVGAKVAITSNRPQTTRHTIRGIVHREDFQIILVDTPGLHRPRTLLGKRLNDLVTRHLLARSTSSGCASRPTRRSAPGTGGSTSRSAPIAPKTTLVVVVTKIDKVPKDRVAAQLVAVSELVGPDCRDRAGVGDDGRAGRRA